MIPFTLFVVGILVLVIATGSSSRLSARLATRNVLKVRTKRIAKFNELAVLMETPDYISLLWFAIASGEPIENAIRIATGRSNGFFAQEFKKVLVKVDHGALLQHELENLAAESRSEQVRELTAKLAISLYNGSSLAEQLAEFAASTNAQLRAALLDRAGKSETKMMIPLVFIILPVTVMFAMYPSLVIIQKSFI